MKKRSAMRLLHQEAEKKPSQKWSERFWQRCTRKWQDAKKNLIKELLVKENRHIVIMSLFMVGAVWISWRLENKYDQMRARVNATQSQKRKQVLEENAYIEKMLQRNPFEPIPIDEEEELQSTYAYEFDTSADLLEVLEQEQREENSGA